MDIPNVCNAPVYILPMMKVHFGLCQPSLVDMIWVYVTSNQIIYRDSMKIGQLVSCKIMAADWSTLPLDPLGYIAIKLETLEDFIYFSVVCRSWNRVSSLIKHQWRPIPMPWLLLAENTSNNPYCVRKIFNPSNNKCYRLNLPETLGARCWGSDYGWVAMVDRSLNVSLFNPITKAEIRFPSAETIPDRRPYDEEVDGDEQGYISWILTGFLVRLIVLKVSENEFVIVVTYGNNDHLVFCYLGIRVFDVVTMDGYLVALYNDVSLVYWKIMDVQGHELVKPMNYSSSQLEMFDNEFRSGIGTLYLVQSGCDLLMVLRDKEEVMSSDGDGTDYDLDIVYETLSFSVYRLDPKHRRWEKIEDHATLFVGGNSTMSVSAKHLQPNFIYFTDDEYELSDFVRELGGHDMGVYDTKCDKIGRFYEGDGIRSEYCRPTWFIPRL
ncbi:F-box protein SKIP23-like [Silene latifolia]|uniref:F-box protein SKIP23-like n=1 Tax=Silene latifolia TaxID=37657 RepID=UPI003D77B750